jgi:predicted N-acyltransferase
LHAVHYVTEVQSSLDDIPESDWDSLLLSQSEPTPFMRWSYLKALQDSGCATEQTGWSARWLMLRHQGMAMAACPLYIKHHSRGEYIFDQAWAQAYHRHGLDYYPKGVVAVPFTPVPGARLLARDPSWRQRLISALLQLAQQEQLSSVHLLWASEVDLQAASDLGLMRRHGVQFHWVRSGCSDFEGFLSTLKQEKRKKIRQERRKVSDAGITFKTLTGAQITQQDWDFFERCYAQTYAEHGNPPYLNRTFFGMMGQHMREHWVMIQAWRAQRPIACSLLAVQDLGPGRRTAYGRYWGALEHHDCLHFETCYHQPIEWCIQNAVDRFEGGAQGEHKMSRALLPVETGSAHWVAHPAFAKAIAEFLERESVGVDAYVQDLKSRTPLRHAS